MNDEEEENAAQLQFGKEFEHDVQYLTNDTVFFLLTNRAHGETATPTETFQQTYSYLDKVVTTKIIDDLRGMSFELSTRLSNLELELKESRKKVKLHQFEIASLANLIKAEETTPEEAISWIPSLTRFDDDEITKAVNIVVETKERFSENI